MIDGLPGDRVAAVTRWLDEAERLDLAVYAAIARTSTPETDRAMARLSDAANYSRLSIASAGALALLGGTKGRRAAAMGLASVAVTATVANLILKPLGGAGARTARCRKSRPSDRSGCRCRARFHPGIRRRRLPSRRVSAMSPRGPRSRCTCLLRSSATRESTPAFISPGT